MGHEWRNLPIGKDALAVDVNLEGAGDVPLFKRQPGIVGRDLDVHPVPEDLGTAVGQHGFHRLIGVEAQPVGVVEFRLRVGGIVARLNQPSSAEGRRLAQAGGVECLSRRCSRSKNEQKNCDGQRCQQKCAPPARARAAFEPA